MKRLFTPDLLPKDLTTESDVEQKFIIQLLKSEKPLGLAYTYKDFRTKPDIRQLSIDKGKKEKLYFPDYVILYAGMPLLVIEAKSPSEDLNEGLREARLYANELNSKFKSKINPVTKVICTNGLATYCCNVDEDEPYLTLELNDFNSVSPKFEKLINDFSRDKIFEKGEDLLRTYRSKRLFTRPTSILGGLTVQNREMPPNTFGANLSLDLQKLFNPDTKEERAEIVKNAYVGVKRHLRHVEPIDKIIRASRPLDSDSQMTILDTEKPIEIKNKLKTPSRLRNQLLLIVGSVGSGKTTFTDYLREVALDEDIKDKSLWISINLNNAPVNRKEIYEWIRVNILSELKDLHSEIDFDDFDNIKRIFSFELGAFKKQIGKILDENSTEYKKLLAEEVLKLKSNSELELKASLRFFCNDKGKLPVIILDNCDKRKLEDQLLAFEVATWLKENFKSLIFLPLRDTTYDFHKKEKPLDTVIKDLVFRIEPPTIKDVIYQRLRLALKSISLGKRTLSYDLPNNFRIEYNESESAFYLVSILRSLFNNTYFNRLITGLAGRDIRKGLEMFLDFCKSGHITEDHIFKIKQSKGEYLIPTSIIARVLIRGNFKYYNEQYSVVKNIFYADPDDQIPNHFIRLGILRWLKLNYKKHGPNKVAGYHRVDELIRDIIPLGFTENQLIKSINFLIKNKAVVTESQSEDEFSEGDLISLGSAGFIYLDLLRDIYYLSAIAEDCQFHENQIAKKISDRISISKHYEYLTVLENAKTLLDFLEDYRINYLLQKSTEFLQYENIINLIDLSDMQEIIERHLSEIHYDDIINIEKEHPINSIVLCEIVFKKEYGVFVEFGLKANGFIHVSRFEKNKLIMEDFEIGDVLECKIYEYNREAGRFNLEILSWN